MQGLSNPPCTFLRLIGDLQAKNLRRMSSIAVRQALIGLGSRFEPGQVELIVRHVPLNRENIFGTYYKWFQKSSQNPGAPGLLPSSARRIHCWQEVTHEVPQFG